MGISDFGTDHPDEEDADEYREEDVIGVAKQEFPPTIFDITQTRYHRMLRILSYVLAYDDVNDTDVAISRRRKKAITKVAEEEAGQEDEVEDVKKRIYDQIGSIYRDRAEGDNLQEEFEADIRRFLENYRKQEVDC